MEISKPDAVGSPRTSQGSRALLAKTPAPEQHTPGHELRQLLAPEPKSNQLVEAELVVTRARDAMATLRQRYRETCREARAAKASISTQAMVIAEREVKTAEDRVRKTAGKLDLLREEYNDATRQQMDRERITELVQQAFAPLDEALAAFRERANFDGANGLPPAVISSAEALRANYLISDLKRLLLTPLAPNAKPASSRGFVMAEAKIGPVGSLARAKAKPPA